MDEVFQFLKRFEKYAKNVDLLIAIAILSVLAVMIIPLPAVLLDLALTLSLASSILILLVSLYAKKALEFSVFPSLLLLTTLFRLALNVATTRLILSEGHNGESSAGAVVHAFGSFVVGDNYVIGFILFLILIVINFVVITKGSGRVAEVAARFTLDAMPGKQMSIDADLNAGLINEEQAKRRRKEIEGEADFYGAMDGASKFVRGDAIAGILIMAVNIIGGLLIGILQHGLDLATAAQTYTKLTIGDGLVTQIPALIISTAAGIIVTRTGDEEAMGNELVSQLFMNPRALYIGAGVIAFLGAIPGLPGIPFFVLALGFAGIAWMVDRFAKEDQADKQRKAEEEAAKPVKEKVETLLPLDLVELEVGYGLINIVESQQTGDLLERIVAIRKQFALDMGIIVPSIHIRDNLQLDPGEYRVLIKGNKVGGGKLRPDYLLAMDPGNTSSQVDGIPTREPAFGLDALWIGKSSKEEAELAGYTVVDLPTVMATHLTEIIRTHAHELLGRQEAASLIDNLKKSYPKVVEDLIPEPMSVGGVVRVLQNLLREQVSIRDLLTIFETLADEAQRTKDTDVLTENVRKALARGISSRYKDENSRVNVLNLAPNLEEMVSNSLLQTDQGVQLVMDPRVAHDMIEGIAGTIERNPEIAGQPILLVSPTARRHIAKLTNRFIPQLVVLSHNEISSDVNVRSVATVEIAHAG
ncbi:MAG: flagellar biosynthesis protein FlhA [Bdellovibrionales bacterium]|jgi:flagellar biosynthesis protein FlhA|nr:flagellar biosynthesis protein FlhA [Bdellovibrionales bacterium]